MKSDMISLKTRKKNVKYLPGTKQNKVKRYTKSYIKCLAILISNCYSSTIVDERNFDSDDAESILKFNQKYTDDRYRCFQVPLND